MRTLAWLARRALIEARYGAECAGYAIRPFDMLADRRRWRWQKEQRCGFSRISR